MDRDNSPDPDQTAVTPQPADPGPAPAPPPADDPRWLPPKAPASPGASAIATLIVVCGFVLGVCLLAAIGGTWVLGVGGLVVLLAAFHYLVWGRWMSRMMAEQQRQELLKLAERDDQLRPDPLRSRHF
jgi:hypothetical protein